MHCKNRITIKFCGYLSEVSISLEGKTSMPFDNDDDWPSRQKNKEPSKEKYCPNCGKIGIARQSSKTGGVLSHMGIVPQRYQCLKCGWIGPFYLNKEKNSETKIDPKDDK